MTGILVFGEAVGMIFVLELNNNKTFMNAVPLYWYNNYNFCRFLSVVGMLIYVYVLYYIYNDSSSYEYYRFLKTLSYLKE
jgi:hypothetical protein